MTVGHISAAATQSVAKALANAMLGKLKLPAITEDMVLTHQPGSDSGHFLASLKLPERNLPELFVTVRLEKKTGSGWLPCAAALSGNCKPQSIAGAYASSAMESLPGATVLAAEVFGHFGVKMDATEHTFTLPVPRVADWMFTYADVATGLTFMVTVFAAHTEGQGWRCYQASLNIDYTPE
jgi:hypothetical protein